MNTSAASAPPTMGDDDIHAFGRPHQPPPAPVTPTRRRRWPWVVLGLGLLGLLGLVVLVSMVHDVGPELGALGRNGDWHVGVGPDGWHGELDAGGAIAAVVVGGLALLVVAVVVPLALLLAGLAVGLSLALALLVVVVVLGLSLGAVALVMLIVGSPLWLLGLLLWWALRPRRPAVASAA